MKSLFVLTLVAIFCINNIQTTDLLLGNTVGAQLAYMENVSLASVPFTVRVKNVFYNNDRNLPIKVRICLFIEYRGFTAMVSKIYFLEIFLVMCIYLDMVTAK